MINYSEIKVGDILEVTGEGAPGYYKIGELVRVLTTHKNSCFTENRDGVVVEFVFNCGAARLNPTEWKEDFPKETDHDH